MTRFHTILSIALSIVLCAGSLSAQSSRELSRRQKQLESLRREIDAYEKKLRESTHRERLTLDKLDDLEQHHLLE